MNGKNDITGNRFPIRLGGPLLSGFNGPEDWAELHKSHGYSAALCPVQAGDRDEIINSYAETAERADIIIAEVGVWNNPLSPDKKEREQAINHCIAQLELADKIGAMCCVNVSGSRSKENWYGPDENDLTGETFDMIVETTQKIIDAVNPKNTFYTLEPMPWSYPDSIDSYKRLIYKIDRKAFGVHFDPVNLISSPQLYFNNGKFLEEFFSELGGHIKSIHAKDIILRDTFTVHLEEVRPGLGNLDYLKFLNLVARYTDLPVILEHLETEEEYKLAFEYIKGVAEKNGLVIHPTV